MVERLKGGLADNYPALEKMEKSLVRKHKRKTKKGRSTTVKKHKRKVRKKSLLPMTQFEQQQALEESHRFFREDPITEFVRSQLLEERAKYLPKPPKGKVRKQKIAIEVTKRLSEQDKEYMERQEGLAQYRTKSLKLAGWEDQQIKDYLGHEIRMDPYFRTFRGRRKKIRGELKP